VFLVWDGKHLSLVLLLIIIHVNTSILIYLSTSSSSLIGFLLFSLFLLTGVFATTSSLLVFFIRYEFSLLPVITLILCWGYQPEKLFASLSLLLYTVICSLPLLFFVLSRGGCLFTSFGYCGPFSLLLILLGFLVKAPIYRLHLWLPKAHVEAPLIGSIVLAGVMLKLGGYGLLVLSPFLVLRCHPFLYLTVFGSVVCSLICFRSWDMKSLVAYSSIVHIGVVSLGVFCGSELGYWVACAMLLAHSLISPLFFVLAHELYLSTSSRCFILGHASSVSSSLLCILSLSIGVSFGLPPFLAFWAELSLFGAVGHAMISMVIPIGLSALLCFLYSVSFLIRSTGGSSSSATDLGAVLFVYFPGLVLSLIGPFASALFLF